MTKDALKQETATTDDLVIERTFNASVEALFSAFTDAEKFAAWWGPESVNVTETDWACTPGSAYHILMKSPESTHGLTGKFISISENKSLEFTWAWDQEDGTTGPESHVRLQFETANSGSKLTLVHSGLPNAEMAQKHNGGWSSSFNCLETFLKA